MSDYVSGGYYVVKAIPMIGVYIGGVPVLSTNLPL
jgi:hypothetical protein